MALVWAASVWLVNTWAVTLVAVAVVTAFVNWFSVATGRRRLEWATKPAVMIVLIAAALAVDPLTSAARIWFLAALVASLAGDVFLMVEPERFMAGLGSFLIAHLGYIAGFTAAGIDTAPAIATVAFSAIAVATIGLRIRKGAAAHDRRLGMPVTAYIVVISAFLVSAVGTTNVTAAIGAVLFYTSDSILGWNKFVAPIRLGRVATMVTYHSAQALLVMSLATL